MKKFKWVVEFTVDETWVADGFELTKDTAKDMINDYPPFSFGSETKARILKAPKKKDIRKAQGY